MHAWMTGPQAPPNDATVGKRVLVNGRFAPYLKVSPGRYRLRLLNASLFSAYDFALSDGSPFVQVGTGNSLLPHPVVRAGPVARAGPARRRGRGLHRQVRRGRRAVEHPAQRPRHRHRLEVGRHHAVPGPRARPPEVTGAREPRPGPADPGTEGRSPRPGPSGCPRRTTARFWSINGKMFDPDRIDYRVRMGDTEQWRLRNVSTMTHYVHLHEEQWHTVSRNGRATTALGAGPGGHLASRPGRRGRGGRPLHRLPRVPSWSTATCSTTRTTG